MGYEQRLGSTHSWRKLRARAARELPLICSNCRKPLDLTARRCTPNAAELDHIVSAAAGGPETIENVQWMCHPCNRRKSDRRDSQPPVPFASARPWPVN